MKIRKFKIRIRGPEEKVGDSLKQAFRDAESGKLWKSPYDLVLTLPDLTWLSKVFSPERMRIVQVVRKEHPKSIYQLAKLLERSLPNVQRDVYELEKFGILELKKDASAKGGRKSAQPICHWDEFEVAV